MSTNPNAQRRAPPLAGRPPFATDEDDSVYDQQPAARPRPRQQQPAQNAGRDSMYQAWDNYLQNDKDKEGRPNSGTGGIGMGLMAGNLDDSDDDDQPAVRPAPVKGTNAPKKPSNLRPNPTENTRPSFESARNAPGNAQIAKPAPALAAAPANRGPSFDRQHPNLNSQQAPMEHPVPRQMQRPAAAALRVDVPQPVMPIPRAPIPAFTVSHSPSPSPSPSLNPHPLNAPSTPITPVFARPSFQSERKVEFAKDAIMRGNSEETLLPRNTAKGEEFWRRFSFVAKEEPKRSKSTWLKSALGSNRSMSRCVWIVSVFLLLAIGGAIGFGWWATHNEPAALPVAVGGSENQSQISTATAAAPSSSNTSRTLIVPTAIETKRAVAYDEADVLNRRAAKPEPTPPPLMRRSRHARRRLNLLDIEELD